MKFRTMLFALAVTFAAPTAAQDSVTSDPSSAPVQVMVVGSYHFSNPGLDMVNMEVDDVLSPTRQREIEVLAKTLAQWQPTKVVVESRAQAPNLTLPNFADVDTLLTTDRNESIQLGYRIADMLGHEAVYGFDEQPEGDEPQYFPMGKVQAVAGETGQQAILQGLFQKVQL